MEVALRSAFGSPFGMGDMASDLIAAGVNPTDAAQYAQSNSEPYVIPYDTSPLPTSLTPTINYDPTAIYGDVGPSGVQFNSDGSVLVQTPLPGGGFSASTFSTIAQAAAALSKSLLAPSAPGVCPTGYRFAPGGASVQLAPGVATTAGAAGSCVPNSFGGAPIISGISNSSLGLLAIGFFALMMFSGGRRR